MANCFEMSDFLLLSWVGRCTGMGETRDRVAAELPLHRGIVRTGRGTAVVEACEPTPSWLGLPWERRGRCGWCRDERAKSEGGELVPFLGNEAEPLNWSMFSSRAWVEAVASAGMHSGFQIPLGFWKAMGGRWFSLKVAKVRAWEGMPARDLQHFAVGWDSFAHALRLQRFP